MPAAAVVTSALYTEVRWQVTEPVVNLARSTAQKFEAAGVVWQVQGLHAHLQRWVVPAAPAAKPWPAICTSMLSKQAGMSLLNGDFEHFDESGELAPGKEVSPM